MDVCRVGVDVLVRVVVFWGGLNSKPKTLRSVSGWGVERFEA